MKIQIHLNNEIVAITNKTNKYAGSADSGQMRNPFLTHFIYSIAILDSNSLESTRGQRRRITLKERNLGQTDRIMDGWRNRLESEIEF